MSPEMSDLLRAAALPILLISTAWLATGCAKRAEESIVPGTTPLSALKQQLGEPEFTTVPTSRPQAKEHHYAGGLSFQSERDVVVSATFPPRDADESTLQYWRHRWAGHPQTFRALPESAETKNPHGHRQYVLTSKQDGMAVVYDEASDSVDRVVKYERR